MRAYITGVAGLIGSSLAMRLLRDGHEVRGCDNLIGGYESNIPKKYIKYDNIDILDFNSLHNAMKGHDVVFHTAALAYEGLSVFSPKLVCENIYSGTVSVASAVIKNNIPYFFNFSSMARYGAQEPPFREKYPTLPEDPYGLAKSQAEQLLSMLSQIHDIKYFNIIPHNVAGPNQVYTDPYRNVMAIFTNRLLQGKSIMIYGDGMQKRSFSHVYDCIEAIVKLLELKDSINNGESFNIGPDGNEITIKELAYKVAHYCSIYPAIEYLPGRPREVKNAWCSVSKAKKILGYQCTKTTDQLIQDTVAYVKNRGTAPFEYKLDVEIIRDNTPKTWTDKLL